MEGGLAVGSAAQRRRQLRRYALYGAAALACSALGYQAYRSDALAQTRATLRRLRAALQRYSEALSDGAELCCTLVRDLQGFLQSDSSEVPGSLRQLARLLQSPEVTQTTAKTVSAVYQGFTGEQHAAAIAGGGQPQRGAVDKVLDALLSDRGHSLVSVAVSMGARNMVGALVEATSRTAAAAGGPPQPGALDKILDFCATERGQQLAVAAITAFVTNGVRVYMDATLDINFYEDIFSSMARPAHLEAVKQCVGMFAREAVGTAMAGGSRPGSPERPARRGRPALIQELPPPSPTGSSPAGSPRHHSQAQRQAEQQQQQCGSSGGGLRPLSPLDSAYARGDTPSLPPSSPSVGQLGSMAEEGSDGEEEASSSDGALAGLHQRRRQHGVGGGSAGGVPAGPAGPADDLDSDSLLHARREGGGKPAAAVPGGGYPWLPAVTREVLTVVKDPNARAVLVGAAGATAHEFGAAMVAGLGQLEITRRWGTRGLLALLLLAFLTICLAQEVLRVAVLAVLR